MSGNSGSPRVIRAIRLRRISSLTDSRLYPLALSSPRVLGRSFAIDAFSRSNQDQGFGRAARHSNPFHLMLGGCPREVNARTQGGRAGAEPRVPSRMTGPSSQRLVELGRSALEHREQAPGGVSREVGGCAMGVE